MEHIFEYTKPLREVEEELRSEGSCPCKICENVLDDGTPILTPPCAFPYEVTIFPDAPPEPRDYEDYCSHYKPPKKP